METCNILVEILSSFDVMSNNSIQVAIVGGGVIGLACARLFSKLGHEIILFERNDRIGIESSARNSEVIHAGIYYPQGSLRQEVCREGKMLMYEYLGSKNISHKKIGKLIVATELSHVETLMKIQESARLNGVKLRILDPHDVTNMEPHVRCVKALWSDTTGIMDSAAYIDQLQYDCKTTGGVILSNCAFLRAENVDSVTRNSHQIYVSDTLMKLSTSQGEIFCKKLINAAGLSACFTARQIVHHPVQRIPKAYYAKGNYFKLTSSSSPFNHLVYPIPAPGGLGIHATIDTGGAVKFGPDVEWLRETPTKTDGDDDRDYEFIIGPPSNTAYCIDEARKEKFVHEIKKYWPAVVSADLVPDYAGIRPKLVGPSGKSRNSAYGRDLRDFVIEGPQQHGVAGLVNLYGVESPGLTSSLVVADYVYKLLAS